jgi:hypothetical protein
MSLFSNGEQGVWIAPSDISTLFQNLAVITPVTTAGQSVALALDNSKSLALGPEIVSNGSFSSGLTGWTTGATVTSAISSGEAQVTFSGSAAITTTNWFYQLSVLSSSSLIYKITFDATTISGGVLVVSSGYDIQVVISANGGVKTSYSLYAKRGFSGSVSDQQSLVFSGAVGAVWKIDNVSVKELYGNHATQSTSGDRPIYTSDKALQNVSTDTINWAAPANTYTVAYRSASGTVILDAQSLSGSTNVMLAPKIYAYVAVNRAIGSFERSRLQSYLNKITA